MYLKFIFTFITSSTLGLSSTAHENYQLQKQQSLKFLEFRVFFELSDTLIS